MFNVTLDKKSLEELNKNGFCIDDSENNIICIRGVFGDPLLEIIQLENDELVVMTEKNWQFVDSVRIRTFFSRINVFCQNTGSDKTEKFELETVM